MKIQKKLLVFAVLLMAASLVFAQASMTSYSTQGLFGTDVDDFMNVNEWQNVQPKNIFGYLGYNTVDPDKPISDGSQKVGNGALNLGIAHQFKAFYLGTYFEGVIPSWEKKTADSPSNIVTTKTKSDNKVTNGKLLFGFGNIGILADASYTPKTNNQKTWDPDTKTKTTNNKFNLAFNLKAGINLNSNNKIFKIAPRIGLNSQMDKNQTVKDGKLTNLTDNSYHDLMIGTGFYHDFSKKDAVTQTIIAELDTSWRIYPKKTGATADSTTSTYGRMHNEITLAPAWQIAYEPEGKFAIKAKVGMKTTFTFNKTKDYDDNSRTGKTYNPSRTHTNTLALTPSLMTGFVYTPISKFKLNFGLGFDVPSLSWTTTKIQTRNSTTGDVTKTENKIDLQAKGSDGTFKASSGFTWLITENVTLDANWNIIKNLLDDKFQTQLSQGGGTSFWNTVNKLAIHKVGFALSVKF